MTKIGVIGTNKSIKSHIEQIKKIPEFELIGIYYHDLNEVNKTAKEFNIKPFNSYKSFVDSVDVIDLASSKPNYYNDAITALKNSKHLFIKSIKNYTRLEVAKLINLANEANVLIQISNSEQFDPVFLVAKKHFDNPMYIEAQYFKNYEQNDKNSPNVKDLIYKDLCVSVNVIKSNAKKINATSLSIINNSPDIINARVEFDNGSVINLTAGRLSNKDIHVLKFFQRNSIIEIDFNNNKTRMAKKSAKRILFEDLETTKNNQILEQLLNFHHSITKNLQPIISIENELKILDVFEEISNKIKLISNQI